MFCRHGCRWTRNTPHRPSQPHHCAARLVLNRLLRYRTLRQSPAYVIRLNRVLAQSHRFILQVHPDTNQTFFSRLRGGENI